MENANVIEFPKDKSVRTRLHNKSQEQKAVVILSIASVLIMTVFLNQWLVQGPEGLGANGARSVASFEPATFVKDIKWEQDLAKDMAATVNSSKEGHVAEMPTLRDELIFGYLEGHYGMKVSQGRIESLEFIDAQAGETPLFIKNKEEFLKRYAEAFGLNYTKVSKLQNGSESSQQSYSLISSSQEIIGQAQFKLDEAGRVESIKFLR